MTKFADVTTATEATMRPQTGDPMTVRVRTFGTIAVVEYLETGNVLALVSPLQYGEPDTSERLLQEWADMESELRREGYTTRGSLEPDLDFNLPLLRDQAGIPFGNFEVHAMYKPFTGRI